MQPFGNRPMREEDGDRFKGVELTPQADPLQLAQEQFKQAEALCARGEFTQAMTKYDEVLRQFPRWAGALGGRGKAWRGLGQYDRAIADLEQALKLDPKNAWAGGELGETYRLKGDLELAVAELSRSLQLDPDDRFWDRLSERIRRLDDPQLTDATAVRIRQSLGPGLLSINAGLAIEATEAGQLDNAGRHIKFIQQSGFAAEVVDEALRRAAEPVVERIRSLCARSDADARSGA